MAGPTLTIEERRARRAERRNKQREIAVLRASKMHHARMLAEKSQTFPEPIAPPALNIGCSGWFYWHLRGSFYPTQMPTKEWFAHYADHFTTVELNAPFYAWPTIRTVQSWLTQAHGREMIYMVKASELITHIKKFEGTATLVRDFGHIADVLGAQMGCFLFQLPPSYHYSPERLRNILDQLDPARRNVTRAGGMTRCTGRSRRQRPSSARAAAPACPIPWSGLPRTSMSGSTGSTVGTATITATRS